MQKNELGHVTDDDGRYRGQVYWTPPCGTAFQWAGMPDGHGTKVFETEEEAIAYVLSVEPRPMFYSHESGE